MDPMGLNHQKHQNMSHHVTKVFVTMKFAESVFIT